MFELSITKIETRGGSFPELTVEFEAHDDASEFRVHLVELVEANPHTGGFDEPVRRAYAQLAEHLTQIAELANHYSQP